MRASDFDYPLPPDRIAQHPAPRREDSSLMILRRSERTVAAGRFADLEGLLNAGDLLVLNDSRVIPARLRAINPKTNGIFEILLLSQQEPNDWWAMMRPAKRAPIGRRLLLLDRSGTPTRIEAEVIDSNDEGHRRIRFAGTASLLEELDRIGEIPLPPYIERPEGPSIEDRERYQTVFARDPGSVAAPTAGLHFTADFLHRLETRGIRTARVTLHVGPGTFAPVKSDDLESHRMHEEIYYVTDETASRIRQTRESGNRVIAVGTTTLRVLESIAREHGSIISTRGSTRLFVYPPYDFRCVNALLTNFHLPKSTLLMLVCAFASPEKTDGIPFVLEAYHRAVREGFRFFSYGDAMFIS